MFYPFFKKISNATPYKNVVLWGMFTALYSLIILINEHFDLVSSLGFSSKTLPYIKIVGVYAYILITTYHFHKEKKRPV